MANELQTASEKLTNQARFIQMIVDKQLVVSKRKKADIVIDLRKHGFRPFPKVAVAKEAGESQDAQEDEDEDNDGNDMNVASGKGKGGSKAETTGDYDYLLGMAISSLTKEKIEKLKVMADDKEKELLRLLDKTPKSMWTADLDEFMRAWEVSTVPFVMMMELMNSMKTDCQQWEERMMGGQKARKGRRKPAVLQTRKSIGTRKGEDDDDDDDFKPIKAPTVKRKVAGETARPPKSTVKKTTKEEDKDVNVSKRAAAKKAPEQKKVKDESEDDYTGEEDVKPKAKAKAAPAKRKVSADKKRAPSKESDDDYDMEVVQRAAPPKRKAAAKLAVIESDSDEDILVLPSKAMGKEDKV